MNDSEEGNLDAQKVLARIQSLIDDFCEGKKSVFLERLGWEKKKGDSKVRAWFTRKSLPKQEDLHLIAQRFDKTYEWLMFGIEDTEVTHIESGKPEDKVIYINLVNVTVGAGNGHVVWNEEVLERIPLTELFFRVNNIRSRSTDLTAVTVDGDSMMPYLLSGDIVFVDHSQTTPGEGVFVVRSHDSVLIKRLQPMIDGRIRLFSFNPDYEPEFVDPTSPAFAIIGRVVWGGRRF
jgi:phage repressor protein C with HTH and peptisase S24 domain